MYSVIYPLLYIHFVDRCMITTKTCFVPIQPLMTVSSLAMVPWFYAALYHNLYISVLLLVGCQDVRTRVFSLAATLLLVHYNGEHYSMLFFPHTILDTPFQIPKHLKAFLQTLQKFLGRHNME